MTHVTEARFHRTVEQRLADLFGADRVEHEKWLDRTTCYADFWVDLGVIVLAVEVENDAGSVRDGVGQALEYAQNDPRAVPLVIVPDGHVEAAQVQELRDVVPIVELGTGGD